MTAPPPAGRALGRRWELRVRTGEGPGRVEYRALDRDVGVEVDLWWLEPSLFDDPARQRQLLAASASVRRVVHPAVRKLFAIAREEGHLVVAWQVASGPVLAPRPHAGAPLDRLAAWFDAVATGLAELHRHGVVHGRLVPEDVVDAGGARVSGAGLWTDVDPTAAARAWRDRERYLAPEVREGQTPSVAADLYSVGAMAAELAAGTSMSLTDALRVVTRRHPPLHDVFAGLVAADPGRRLDLAAAAAAVRAASSMPYLADDRSGPHVAIAASTRLAPSRPPSAPAVHAAHPAFAPLTPVSIPALDASPVASAAGAAQDEADPTPDTRIDADPASLAPRTVVGHAPGPSPRVAQQPASRSPSAPAASGPLPDTAAPARAVVHAVSMKPADPPRAARPSGDSPAAGKARVRRLSTAMARSFSTAPGALGYLAPPRAPTSPPARHRIAWWLAAAAAALAAGAASFLALR